MSSSPCTSSPATLIDLELNAPLSRRVLAGNDKAALIGVFDLFHKLPACRALYWAQDLSSHATPRVVVLIDWHTEYVDAHPRPALPLQRLLAFAHPYCVPRILDIDFPQGWQRLRAFDTQCRTLSLSCPGAWPSTTPPQLSACSIQTCLIAYAPQGSSIPDNPYTNHSGQIITGRAVEQTSCAAAAQVFSRGGLARTHLVTIELSQPDSHAQQAALPYFVTVKPQFLRPRPDRPSDSHNHDVKTWWSSFRKETAIDKIEQEPAVQFRTVFRKTRIAMIAPAPPFPPRPASCSGELLRELCRAKDALRTEEDREWEFVQRSEVEEMA